MVKQHPTGQATLVALLMLVLTLTTGSLRGAEITPLLSSSELSVGDIVEYRLRLPAGAAISGTPRPTDSTVAYTGTAGQSETFGMGRQAERMIWWQFEALEPGPFTIQPPRITRDGSSVPVAPVSGTVRARPGIDLSSLGEVGRAEHQNLRRRFADDLFTAVEVSNPEPFVGEVIEVNTYVYWRGGAGLQPRQGAGRSWPGGSAVSLVEDPMRARRPQQWIRDGETVRIDDRVFFRHLIMSAPVVAVRSGSSTLQGSRVALDLGTAAGFDFAAPSKTINVRSLPEAPQPVVARVVGRPTISLISDREELRQGELLKIDIRISGEGHFELARLENIPAVHGLLEVDRETSFNLVRAREPVATTRNTSIVYQVTEAGRIDFPELAFAVLDPETGEYHVTHTEPMTFESEPSTFSSIHVAGEQGPAGRPIERGRARLIETDGDLLHIETGGLSGPVRGRQSRPLALHPVYWAAHAVPLGILAAAGFIASQRRKRESDGQAVRRREARHRALEELHAAEVALRASDAASFYAALGRALDAIATQALEAPAAGLTREEITEGLRQQEVAPEAIALLEKLRDQCDTARYAPGALTDATMEDDLAGARDLAARIIEPVTDSAATGGTA